jgi:hypothetical protein
MVCFNFGSYVATVVFVIAFVVVSVVFKVNSQYVPANPFLHEHEPFDKQAPLF